MSAMSEQTDLDTYDEDIPWYLTRDKSRITIAQLQCQTSREFYCSQCSSRVTQSSTKSREYGHAPSCEFTIRRFDDHALDARDGDRR